MHERRKYQPFAEPTASGKKYLTITWAQGDTTGITAWGEICSCGRWEDTVPVGFGGWEDNNPVVCDGWEETNSVNVVGGRIAIQ